MSETPLPGRDEAVVGVSDRDEGRDVETFFATYPFESEAASLATIATESFFRRFLDAPESSGSR